MELTTFQDLAALVDNQQENIDKIADSVERATGDTRAGFDRIRQSSVGLCGMLEPVSPRKENTGKKPKHNFRVAEEFKWSMPFETINEDINDVKQDLMQVANDLMDELQENIKKRSKDNSIRVGCCTIPLDLPGIPKQKRSSRTFGKLENTRFADF